MTHDGWSSSINTGASLIQKERSVPGMDYNDETWYVDSDGHKYYPRSLSSPNAHT